MVTRHGNNLFYRDVNLRLLCCQVRKVLPLRRALMNYSAWVTGLHRDHFLHKISLTTGADVIDPVEIAGSSAGIPFNSRYQLQRTALLRMRGRVYIAFASHKDETPYYGWMFAYDADLRQTAVMNYSPFQWGAGIWQSGGGPASDGSYIYLNTEEV